MAAVTPMRPSLPETKPSSVCHQSSRIYFHVFQVPCERRNVQTQNHCFVVLSFPPWRTSPSPFLLTGLHAVKWLPTCFPFPQRFLWSPLLLFGFRCGFCVAIARLEHESKWSGR
uniref:Uncharacterized protein n=1 Tax=Anguilla anguilla TaxID=7936 RepID=A0A0E9WMF1_ANGAN